jgi:hypothetical protein
MMVLDACKSSFLDTRLPKTIRVNVPNQDPNVKGGGSRECIVGV